MIEKANGFPDKPRIRPQDPRFSSGPCKKFPGWDITRLNTDFLGRSHRAKTPKTRLTSAIERSHALLDLPPDWRLGIVPGSDTGALEIALWSMLGNRAVDALVWDSFSSDWAKDLNALGIPDLTCSSRLRRFTRSVRRAARSRRCFCLQRHYQRGSRAGPGLA